MKESDHKTPNSNHIIFFCVCMCVCERETRGFYNTGRRGISNFERACPEISNSGKSI